MRVISKITLVEAIRTYPELEKPLLAWYKTIKHSRFDSLEALREAFGTADPVGRATVFNIKGNKYRLITAIHYNTQITYVLEVLTHAEYSKDKWKDKHHVYC